LNPKDTTIAFVLILAVLTVGCASLPPEITEPAKDFVEWKLACEISGSSACSWEDWWAKTNPSFPVAALGPQGMSSRGISGIPASSRPSDKALKRWFLGPNPIAVDYWNFGRVRPDQLTAQEVALHWASKSRAVRFEMARRCPPGVPCAPLLGWTGADARMAISPDVLAPLALDEPFVAPHEHPWCATDHGYGGGWCELSRRAAGLVTAVYDGEFYHTGDEPPPLSGWWLAMRAQVIGSGRGDVAVAHANWHRLHPEAPSEAFEGEVYWSHVEHVWLWLVTQADPMLGGDLGPKRLGQLLLSDLEAVAKR